jgi:membrane-bound metal-dependent hydrolase YbcI (DUF457 family)
MRGFTHFIMGAAIVTFFASAMEGVQPVVGHSFIILIGAFFGLLPDTLDFKIMQYIETHHVEIDPDPKDPKPQDAAEKIASAINRASELPPGQMIKLRLHTTRLSAEWWRYYTVFFNTRRKEVEVQIGPKTNIVGEYFLPGSEPPAEKAFGAAKFNPEVIDPYGKPSRVAGFSGPSFGFLKRKDGKVEVVFLPWHRRSVHSLTAAGFFGLFGYLIASLLGSQMAHVYGLAIFLPYALHVLIDSYGHMGSNLFWPFTRQRTPGLGFLRASDPFWNFFAVYTCVMFMFWNMNKYALNPQHKVFGPEVPFWYFLLLAVVLPWVLLGALVVIYKVVFEKKRPEYPVGVPTERPEVAEDFGEMRGFGEVEYEIRERPIPWPMWVWRGVGIGLLIFIFLAAHIWGPTL